MKNVIIILHLVLLSGCFGKSPTIESAHKGKPLPAIDLLLLDSTTQLNINSIPSSNPIVFFYFNPYCPYCRSLTEDLVKNMTNLSGIQFILLSSYPLSEIKKYNSNFNFKKYKNILVAQDYQNQFLNYFNIQGVPYLAIYNKDKLLKQVLMGTVNTDLIKEITIK